MELVNGVSITKYCDDNRLTPRGRLELFVPVCQAIQHAHQKGIIHRDIKPSNVMVTLYDGKPVPKVIDFGVAKATEQKLTERTLFTEYGTMIGTLEYMSPEQAEMSALGVDTRSDIYSLGVLLYELLTGSTPLSRQQMKQAAFGEILRLIKEEEPPRPSTRLSDSGEALASISALRQTEPSKLSTLMRGELDWIVMKTLEKDRNRRYETANAFAADVQRYLADEPVQACPPSAWYRFRKFSRRNKAALTMASLMTLAVLLVVGSFGWMVRDRVARDAELARDRAARQTKLNHQVELALQEASGTRDLALTLTDNPHQWEAMLVASSSALKRAEGLAAQNEAALDSGLLGRLQALSASLNTDEKDRRFIARFDEIRLAQSEIHPAVRELNLELALPTLKEAFETDYQIIVGVTPVEEVVRAIQQRPKAIQEHLLAALDVCLAHVPREEPQARPWLSAVLENADVDPWRKSARQALAARDWLALEKLVQETSAALQPPTFLSLLTMEIPRETPTCLNLARQIQRAHRDDFWANHNLAGVLHYREFPQYDEAIRYYTAAMALRPRNPGVLVNLGNALIGKDDLDGAMTAYRDALAVHPDNPLAHERLGLALEQKGRLDEAIAELRESIRLRTYVPDYVNLGALLARRGLCDEAIAVFKQAIELDPIRAIAHRWGRAYELGTAYNAWAWLLATAPNAKVRNPPEAVKLAKKAVEFGPENADYWNTLGAAQYRAGAWQEAVLALQKSMDLGQGGNAFDWLFLGMAHWQLGQKEEARKQYDRAVRWAEKNESQDEELRRFRAEATELLGIKN